MALNPPPRRSLPSFVRIILFLLGFAALSGGVFVLFTALLTVEGLASVILLILALVVMYFAISYSPERGFSGSSFMTAMGILYFAGMGFTFDQTGNALYNLPIEWLFCPQNSTLTREVDVRSPRPGTTSVSQDFNCVDVEGFVVDQITILEIIVVRFVEYLILGYVLLYGMRLYKRLRYRPDADQASGSRR